MSSTDKNDDGEMGELVDLAEWKERKEEEEKRQLDEEIAYLKAQIREYVEEAEDPITGPYFWTEEFRTQLMPLISSALDTLDGYSMSGSVGNPSGSSGL